MRKMLRSLAASVALVAGVSATANGTHDYGPRDETERGLWQQMDEYERDLKTSEFLMTAFYASGDGMTDAMDHMRARLGLGWDVASAVFDIDDARARDLLQRYTCLGGVALVSTKELETAAMLDGEPLLTPELIQEIRAQNLLGHGVIATGRRAGGGTIYFLVAPEPAFATRLTEGFTHLRGLPARIVVLSPPSGSTTPPQ